MTQDDAAKSAPTYGSLSCRIREIEREALLTIAMGVILFAAGVALAATGEPEFGHGCMAGMGGMLPIIAGWKARALLWRLHEEDE